MGDDGGQGEIKMASASTPSANEQAKDVVFVHTVQLKPMIKTQITGRMISSGISDVAIASVYSEKNRLKKLIMIIIMLMKNCKKLTIFGGHQILTFTMKLRPEK